MTTAGLTAELYRLRLMRGAEEELASAGFEPIAGVDEAGRGCLAGPVVAAAVIPQPGLVVPGIDDSKALTAKARSRLADWVRRTSIAYEVIAVGAEVIDQINILQATRQAMSAALQGLEPQPQAALVDAVALAGCPFPCLGFVRGDALSYAIACASILAKETRDRMMIDADRSFPQYGFADNKGYAAPVHLQALSEYGPSPVHRLTFRSVIPRREGGARLRS